METQDIVQYKVGNVVEQINSLNAIFSQSETITSADVLDSIQKSVKDIKDFKNELKELPATEVINLEIMVEDFAFIRETLMSTVKNGRQILDSLSLEVLASDDDTRPDMIASFASLLSSVTNSMRLLASSYKDISSVLLNIEKLKPKGDKPDGKGKGNIHIENINVISTADLIAKMRIPKE